MEKVQQDKLKLQEESQKRKEILTKAQQHQVAKQGSKLGKVCVFLHINKMMFTLG